MKIFLLISVVLVSNLAWADCHIEVARTAGKYLLELEKAKLRSYQDNSVCEVLDRELEECSKVQLADLEKTFDVKEVLGIYCQPHLPPYPMTDKAQFLKGADLFSWKETDGYYWYAVLPGTNRLKTIKEIRANRMSYSHLKVRLEQLPPNTDITWNNLSAIDIEKKQSLNFSIPPQHVVEKIKTDSIKAKLMLKN